MEEAATTTRLGPSVLVPMSLALVIALLVGTIYWPCVFFDFVSLDDYSYVVRNPGVWRSDGLAWIWSTTTMPSRSTNWPLTFTSFWIEYRLWGPSPAGYHIVNIVLHSLASWLLGVFLSRLGASRPVAWTVAVWFAVHPLNVMSVAWVTERKNVLSAVFFFASLCSFVEWRSTQRRHWGIAYGLLFACALASKSSVVLLPLVALVIDLLWFERRRSLVALGRQLVPLTLAAIACLLTLRADFHGPTDLPWWPRPFLAATAVWFYVGKILWPVDLRVAYDFWNVELGNLWWWLAPVSLIAGTVALGAKRQSLPRFVAFGIAYYLLMILPVCGIVPFGFTEISCVADYLSYLPSVGVLLIVAAGLHRALGHHAVAFYLMVALVTALFALRAHQQTFRWENDESLYADFERGAVSQWVWSHKARWLLGQAKGRERVPRFLDEFERRFPTSAEPLVCQAELQRAAGNLERAQELLEQALKREPHSFNALSALADVHALTGAAPAARRLYEKAYAICPRADVWRKLAMTYTLSGEPARALPMLRAVLDRTPYDEMAHFSLGFTCERLGLLDAAAGSYHYALAINPASANAAAGLERIARSKQGCGQTPVGPVQDPGL